MSQLTDAVEVLRAHDEQLSVLLDGLLGELATIQRSVTNMKKSLASERNGATEILDALETLELLEIEWSNAAGQDEIRRRRVGVEIIKRARSVYATAHNYAAREDRDPVVAAIAQDIRDRFIELAEDLFPAFGLDAAQVDLTSWANTP